MASCRLNNNILTVKNKTIKNLADKTGEVKTALKSQLVSNTGTNMVLIAITPTFNILPGIHKFPVRKEIDFVADRPRYNNLTSKISTGI